MTKGIGSSDIGNKNAASFEDVKKVGQRNKKDGEQSQDQQKGTDDQTFIRVFNELVLLAMKGNARLAAKTIRYTQ